MPFETFLIQFLTYLISAEPTFLYHLFNGNMRVLFSWVLNLSLNTPNKILKCHLLTIMHSLEKCTLYGK